MLLPYKTCKYHQQCAHFRIALVCGTPFSCIRYSRDNAHAACSFSFQQTVAHAACRFSLRTITTADGLWFGLTAADHDDELAATSGRNLLGTTYYYSYHNYHEPSAAAAAAAAAGGDSAAAAAAASSGMPCLLHLAYHWCANQVQIVQLNAALQPFGQTWCTTANGMLPLPICLCTFTLMIRTGYYAFRCITNLHL